MAVDGGDRLALAGWFNGRVPGLRVRPRSRSIRFLERAGAKWLTKPQPRFVVSTQALLEVDGVPYKRTLNLWLAAAKHPIQTSSIALALVWAVWAGWRRWRKK